jgi:hypothetical protein
MTYPLAGRFRATEEAIFQQVADERRRQDAKWGQQSHPNGSGPDGLILGSTEVNLDLRTGEELANIFRARCDRNHRNGCGDWIDILLEEIFEAFAESDPARLRTELIQCMAVIEAWVEDIDRKSALG